MMTFVWFMQIYLQKDIEKLSVSSLKVSHLKLSCWVGGYMAQTLLQVLYLAVNSIDNALKILHKILLGFLKIRKKTLCCFKRVRSKSLTSLSQRFFSEANFFVV